MPDNTNQRNAPDSKRINPNEDYEVRYWSEKFGVSAEKLKQAVEKVGTSAEKVEEFLKRR
ncbi:MAG: DUF3606 domain-containing protein [Sphingobacteriales bacterium]|nr:MAG: DUF3606 domain-containing protein [Sphingobacteriales bacterium]